MLTIADLAPKVATFIARNRQSRELTADEKRLAVTAPEKFNALIQSLQLDMLDDLRNEAALGVLQEDLAEEQAAERAAQAAQMGAEREELLALRHEASLEIDAALADIETSLVSFQALNGQIASLDRALGETDRHRAGYGLMALVLKRTIHRHAPTLFKLTGGKLIGYGRDGLSEASKPADYDLATRLGGPDPFDT